MRLIDADELFKKVDGSRFKNNHKTSEGRMVHNGEHNHFMKMIADAPTVDAQPVVHGKWIFSDEPTFGNPYGNFKCSICGSESGHKENYCCDCGARMDD